LSGDEEAVLCGNLSVNNDLRNAALEGVVTEGIKALALVVDIVAADDTIVRASAVAGECVRACA
jgi:hypothetical protein